MSQQERRRSGQSSTAGDGNDPCEEDFFSRSFADVAGVDESSEGDEGGQAEHCGCGVQRGDDGEEWISDSFGESGGESFECGADIEFIEVDIEDAEAVDICECGAEGFFEITFGVDFEAPA